MPLPLASHHFGMTRSLNEVIGVSRRYADSPDAYTGQRGDTMERLACYHPVTLLNELKASYLCTHLGWYDCLLIAPNMFLSMARQ